MAGLRCPLCVMEGRTAKLQVPENRSLFTMASSTPIKGRCNHPMRKQPGMFCGNKPVLPDHLGGNGKCKFHGGLLPFLDMKKRAEDAEEFHLEKQDAKKRHGLYSDSLKALFRDAKAQLIFADEDTPKLDLTPEIRLWRTKIYQWEKQKQEGLTLMETEGDKFVSLDEVLYKAGLLLARLIKTQKELHPEADANGELTVRLVLDESSEKKVQEMDMPDLEAGGGTPEPVKQQTKTDDKLLVSPFESALKDFADSDDDEDT